MMRDLCNMTAVNLRSLLARKEALSRRRARLARTLPARVPTVATALARGDYHRLARGWRSAGHDLLIGR